MQHIKTFFFVIVTCLMYACSTTSNLPEGETLYTGVNRIDYLEEGRQKAKSSKKDTTGVIMAIAKTVERVDKMFQGTAAKLSQPDDEKKEDDVSKSERKINASALATASEEVNAVLEYAPNNPLFGSAYYRTPFPFGLWAYNKYVNKTGKFQKWMFKSFASDPVLITTVNPDTRVKVATNTLHNYGYFHGNVKYNIDYNRNKRKAKISYDVTPGRVFCLDSINYVGYSPVEDSLIRQSSSKSLLRSGDPFNVINLTGEQSRLEKLFRNEGYYFYQASNSTYRADTLMKPYKVQLIMFPSANIRNRAKHRWYMGDTYINISKQTADTTFKSFDIRNVHFQYQGKKIPLRPIVWFQSIAHRSGRLYRQTDQENTQSALSSLGVFSQYNLTYMPRDTSQTCDTLDLYINATMDRPYTTDLEMNVTEKNANRIGPGLSLNIQRKNAFRGAEFLNWKLYGSYEWRTRNENAKSSDLFNSYEVGTQFSVDFSHIVFPGINRRTFRFPTATSFSISADWMNRAQYFNLFSLGTKVTYSWHKNKTTRHELIPFSLSYDKLIRSSVEFDSIMRVNPALFTSMRDRFVPSMQYTFTYQSAPHHRNPGWWQISVKEAGNITSACYAIGGKSFNEKDKHLLSNPFAQYLKLTTELHNNFKISQNTRLVTRLAAGIVYSYGNSDVAPYSDQFFVGGANSVRAFTIRSIGPGHYTTEKTKYSYMDQTGDIKLEANIEYRFPLFGSLQGAVFLDAGNVWLLREDEKRPGGKFKLSRFFNDLAVGTGAGLRYDLEFLVLRFDLGIAIHDPADTHKSGYYNINKFKDGLALHFAIGYPF